MGAPGTTFALLGCEIKLNGSTPGLGRKADHILDFRGTITAITLLKATRVLREMRTSETMEVLGCQADTLGDLFKVLPASCYEVISMEAGKGESSLYRILLKKVKEFGP